MVRQALGVAWLPTSGESTDGAAAREAMQSQTHGERKASAKSDLDRGRLNDCNAGSRLGSAPGAIEPSRAAMVDSGGGLWPQQRDAPMQYSFAYAATMLEAATGLDEAALLHVGDTEAEVASSLATLTGEGTAAVTLGHDRELIIEAFTHGWQQKLQAFDIRLRVGAQPIMQNNLSMNQAVAGQAARAMNPTPGLDLQQNICVTVRQSEGSQIGAVHGDSVAKPPSAPAVLSQAEKDDAALDRLIREAVSKAPAIFAAVPIESGFFVEFGDRSLENLEILIRPLFLKRKDGGTLTPQGAAKCWRGLLSFLDFVNTKEAEPTDKLDLCLYFKHRRDCACKHRRSVGTGSQASKAAYSHLEWGNRVFRLGLPLDDELVRSHAACIGTVRKVLACLFFFFTLPTLWVASQRPGSLCGFHSAIE